MASNKRKHKTLTLREKVDIISRLDEGQNMRKLAKEYDVGKSTLHDIKKNKLKILERINSMESGLEKRKTLKLGDCPKMEADLYTWFVQQRANDKLVNRDILRTKAVELYKEITKKDDFCASNGWFTKFKKRFGIHFSTPEKYSDVSAVPFVQILEEESDELKTSSSKRKHKTLTLREKMDIISKLDKGQNMCQVAKEYGVGRSTLHDIKKNKSKILEHVNSMESGIEKRKTLRLGDCPQMETALYTWFVQQRAEDKPVTGDILKNKAAEIHRDITKSDDFRASDGWLDKFKKRFGILLSKGNYSNVSTVPFVQIFIEENDCLSPEPSSSE